MNLLMIDDNPAMLAAAKTALQGIHSPLLAETGEGGIKAFRRYKPDVVVLDMRLPDLGGLEVLTILKSINPAVPVIVLTALDNTTLAAKAIRAGAFTYLIKPLELRSLLCVIQDATDKNPVVNGVILPSIITKDLYKKLAHDYVKNDIIVLVGEKGVGKRALARALHTRFHGSDHSFFQVDLASLPDTKILAESPSSFLTVCFHVVFPDVLENDVSYDLFRRFRKVIVTIETPFLDRNAEVRTELALSKKWVTHTIPPLRYRRNEAFPLLCYWHQRLSPEKTFDIRTAQEDLNILEEASFPGNVLGIVTLARKLTQS